MTGMHISHLIPFGERRKTYYSDLSSSSSLSRCVVIDERYHYLPSHCWEKTLCLIDEVEQTLFSWWFSPAAKSHLKRVTRIVVDDDREKPSEMSFRVSQCRQRKIHIDVFSCHWTCAPCGRVFLLLRLLLLLLLVFILSSHLNRRCLTRAARRWKWSLLVNTDGSFLDLSLDEDESLCAFAIALYSVVSGPWLTGHCFRN